MVLETPIQDCYFSPEVSSLYTEKVEPKPTTFLNTEFTKEIVIQVIAGLIIVFLLYIFSKRLK